MAQSQGTWLALGGPQQLPVAPEQWMPYEGEPAFLLLQAYNELVQVKGKEADGRLLDMSMFTEPPLPYIVCKGKVVEVKNRNAAPELQGKRTVAGYDCNIWDTVVSNSSCLPGPLRAHSGVPGAYFYQVHHESIDALDALERFLQDETGSLPVPSFNPRRRIVILVTMPQALSDTRRFAKRRQRPEPAYTAEPASSSAVSMLTEVAGAAVTVIGEGDIRGVTAVYEWWFGPAPPQDECQTPLVGRWKSYHPQVCKKLEHLFKERYNVKIGKEPMDVDGVRYLMQHVTKTKNFDYMGQPSREEFTQKGIITIDHLCFSDMDRNTDNCFVQFQKGNPHRRRPARRRPDAAETAAKGILIEGQPCNICFSEDGQLTGCNLAHVICKSCLRAALRNMAGDTLTVEHLICGCFDRKSRRALFSLSQHADVSLQDWIANPPTGFELQDFEAEKVQTLRQFDLNPAGGFPDNLYAEKIREWFHKVNIADVAHLYYACSHPSCAERIENWILMDDFEKQYQARGQCTWFCPDGHRNSVLPSQEEINEINKSLLLHPEYYVDAAMYDNCPLRRYRICAQCVTNGSLMLAVHGGECKQWPGYGRGHQHCFCFSCTRKWGEGCDHQSRDCRDPGVQQVRRADDRLEIGFVNGQEYLAWLNNQAREPPPTRFSSGAQVPGMTRQQELGLTDRAALLAESRQGTT